VVQGQYAPGSTFKLLTSIAALENGITTLDEPLYDEKGYVEFGNPPLRFYNAGREPSGTNTLPSALTVSSDTYFYTMGFRFWGAKSKGDAKKGDGIQTVAKRYGFGKPTGVGLANEFAGRIPDQAFKEKINASSSDPFSREWLPGDSANLAVGQGDVLVTPIQLANAYATFANGGSIYSPRLASKILTPGAASNLRDLPSQLVSKVKLKPEYRDAIMGGLDGVTKGGGGTATDAFSGYSGMDVAGKTGTAEVSGKQDTSLFAAIVNPNPPPDSGQPQYVVVVIVEQAGFGGGVAAPIARRIIESLNGNLNPAAVKLVAPKRD